MIVDSFSAAPAPTLGLDLFERQFCYPLGPGRSFRIEHGDDYARFYRAIGDARCFVALGDASVLGVLAVAIRPLRLPDGRTVRAAYIGDLKVAPEARRGIALYRLCRTAETWARPRADVAFGVVMDGTASVPSQYSGRAGIPSFAPVGKVVVLRFLCPVAAGFQPAEDTTVEEGAGRDGYLRLSAGCCACPAGNPGERSLVSPCWLMLPDGSACGCLEDTRRAKRLIATDGELVSAHLSCFAWKDARAAATLLGSAIARAAAADYPALFVSVDARDATAVLGAMRGIEVVQAPATVYGHGLPAGAAWNLNSAEI